MSLEQPIPSSKPDGLQSAWQQSQPAAISPLTANLLGRAARTFRWKSRLSDTLDLVFLAAQVVFFAAAAWFGDLWLCRIGCGLFAMAGANAVREVAARGWARSAAVECMAFYRAELERRRDLAGSFPRWGIYPFVPGVLLGLGGWVAGSPPAQWPTIAGVAAFWLAMQQILRGYNADAAARLQREIDLLDQA